MAFPTYPQLEKIIKGTKWDVDHTGDFDCVDVAKEADSLFFPGIGWATTGIHGNGKDIFYNANPKYYQKIKNDPTNPNQLPKPGDIICFDATPKAGYTNTFKNPYGHVALFKSSANGQLTILMQASGTGQAAYLDTHSWKFRPAIGWLRPIAQTPAPAPQPTVPKSQLDSANATIADLRSQLSASQGKITELGKVITNLQNQITSLKAQLGDATKWQTLGSLLRELLGLNK